MATTRINLAWFLDLNKKIVTLLLGREILNYYSDLIFSGTVATLHQDHYYVQKVFNLITKHIANILI